MNRRTIFTIIAAVLLLLGALGVFAMRFDLTKEKRYTLADTSVKVLKSVRKPMMVEVYLDGDFPASFKQLQNETRFMLEEFHKINPKIDFKFIDPIATKMSKDTLMAMGMQPSQLSDVTEGGVKQVVMFPYAAIKYNSYGTSVPLIVQQNGLDSQTQLNKSIENLEYTLVSGIKGMVSEKRKSIGILVNQNELRPDEFRGFMEMALENYNAGPVVPSNGAELSVADVPKLKQLDALVIAKPRKAFTETEKVVLDQYIINGGRTLWMIDAVNAEMDTLFRSEKIMAYPVDTNMTDFFFNYGIRINPGLVKDYQKSALIRLVTGEVAGNPQYTSMLWPYFPLGISDAPNPITKNINPVKFQFPTAIDTLGRPGIKTTVLFESSSCTSVKPVPNYVSLREIAKSDSLAAAEKRSNEKIFAVSLEGKFKSAYAARSERSAYPGFKAESGNNRMIVIADGDVGKNQIYKGQPLPLSVMDLLTQQDYGNEQFLRNCLDYLLDDGNLMSLRNRNVEARLLDRQRIEDERSYWQFLNLLLPLAVIGALGALFYWLRNRKFAGKEK